MGISAASYMEWHARPLEFRGPVEDAVVPMTRTGSCLLRFKNADGTPLAGAGHYWTPQLRISSLATENLETTAHALDHLLRHPKDNHYNTAAFLPPILETTDANGEMLVEGLPPGLARFGMHVNHKKLEPTDPQELLVKLHPNPMAAFPVVIKPGETVQAEFTVRPVGN